MLPILSKIKIFHRIICELYQMHGAYTPEQLSELFAGESFNAFYNSDGELIEAFFGADIPACKLQYQSDDLTYIATLSADCNSVSIEHITY